MKGQFPPVDLGLAKLPSGRNVTFEQRINIHVGLKMWPHRGEPCLTCARSGFSRLAALRVI